MSEMGLYSFQLAEIFDSLTVITSCALLSFGVGLWVHATYFRRD